MRLFSKIERGCAWLRRRRRLAGVAVVEYVNDVPDRTGGMLFIVVRGGLARRAFLDCPCRCGRRLELNLSPQRSPFWVVHTTGNKATLRPSVWVPADQCGSHFFVTASRIKWVG